MCARAVLFFVALVPAAGILRGTNQILDLNLALNNMRPAQVSKLLNQVEMRWEEARVSSLRNQTSERVGLEEMIKSCSKVAEAIVGGSSGDKDKVVEYMQDVCSSNTGEVEAKKCKQFASGVEGAMSDDAQVNRNDLELSKFCQAFWTGPVSVAAKEQAQQLDEQDAKKAEQEAKDEEAKTNEALAVKQDEQKQAANEAVNKSSTAIQHASEVDKEVKSIEDSMAADDKNATKLLEQARQEEQVADEKEVKAAEQKAAEEADAKAAEQKAAEEADAKAAEQKAAEEADAKVKEDEAKAIEEGDAKADAIAEKAMEKAEVAQPVEQNATSESAAAKDDANAVAAGDKIAENITEKALKKAALVAKKF